MNKRLRGSRRALTKKVTSINFYVDQATQIQAIMETNGETKEAPLVRQLVDEALSARRRKSIRGAEAEQPPPTQDIHETLQTIQTLLLRQSGQVDCVFRIQSVCLELLQESLAETRAGRTSLWEFLASSALQEKGRRADEIARLFEGQSQDAKSFAYGLAEEIKKQLDADLNSINATTDDEDRQGSFVYDLPDTQPN